MKFGVSFNTVMRIRAGIALGKFVFLFISTLLVLILAFQWIATLPNVWYALGLVLAGLGFFVILGLIFRFPRDASRAWWIK